MPINQIQFYLRKQIFVRGVFIAGLITLVNAYVFYNDTHFSWLRVTLIGVFGAITIFFIYRAVSKKAVLIFSADGIFSSTASKSVIPWQSIREIKTVEIQRQKLLCLTVGHTVLERTHNTPFLEKRRRWMVSRLQLIPAGETDYLFAAISNLTEAPEMIEKRALHLHSLTSEMRAEQLQRWQNEQARR
jgi:hypothetical protein